MKDQWNRTIDYLRISVTDRCDFRCRYCMPEKGIDKLAHEEILSLEEIADFVRVAAEMGIRKVRLTGGEPMVRPDLIKLVRMIRVIDGIEEIGMTTNGSLLSGRVAEFHEAGVDRFNFSIDTLQPEKFHWISRRVQLDTVMAAIEESLALGLKTKVNVVLMGGFNDEEIPDFVNWTRKVPIGVRFIELMPMGEARPWDKSTFISNDTVLERCPELAPVGSDGVSALYQLPGGKGTVGLISPLSHRFCADCTRLRLTADGKIISCLHSAGVVEIKGKSPEEYRAAIEEALAKKPMRHHLKEGGSEQTRRMNAIGG